MLFSISVSHKTASAEIRKLFLFNDNKQKELIKAALMHNISECIVLCTCSRSEFYFCGDDSSAEIMKKLISEATETSEDSLVKYYNIYREDQAVRHIFKVASGLDSMLLGEDEILGQVKTAFLQSLRNGTTGYVLNTVFKTAITAAKKIKTNTAISKTPISIGTLAANEACDFYKTNPTVMIIGITGKMGTVIAKNLYGRNIKIIGISRNHNSIFDYADSSKISFIEYKNRYSCIDTADIVISATTSPHCTITYSDASKHIKTVKPRLFIDLAVPFDIDKGIEKLTMSTLLDIDHFEKIAEANNKIKSAEALKGLIILDDYIDICLKELCFHRYKNYLDSIKAFLDTENAENILYKLKTESDSIQFEAVMNLLHRITEE